MTLFTRKCYKCGTTARLTTDGLLIICMSCESDKALIEYGLIKS